MQYILVTGSTGFIGSNLIEKLLNEGNNVLILKRSFSDTWRINNLFEKFPDNLIYENIDLVNLEDIFGKYTINGVFHLATYYNKNPSFDELKPMAMSNILFPIELLNLSVKYSVKYFINTGTFMEFTLDDNQLAYSYEKNPKTFYAATKISFEEMLKYYANNYDIHAATLKIYSPYGEKDDVRKIIPYLILNSLENKEISINFPENRLNLVYVEDIINAFIKVKENIRQFDSYETFDVANNLTYSLNDVNLIIQRLIGNEKIKVDGRKIGEFPNINNNEKIGWYPRISLELGLMRTIDYYMNYY